MSLSTAHARTAIRELLEGTLSSATVTAGMFGYGVFEGQPIQATQAMAVQTAIATHRFDVQFTAFSNHATTHARRGSRRLVTAAVTIPMWTHVATTAQATDRSAVLAAIGEDMAAGMRALGYPNALEATSDDDATTIVGGLLHGPGGAGFPQWRVVNADWNAQLVRSEIVGSLILDATVTLANEPGELNAAPFAAGALSTDFNGWSAPAPLTVFSFEGQNYFRDTANVGLLIFETESSERDVEVEFWGNQCVVYIRLDEAGKGYYCSVSASSVIIGVATGVTSSAIGTLRKRAETTVGAIPGYVSTPATDTWTFGVRGHYLYVKWNGTEIIGDYDIIHPFAEGKVAARATSGVSFFGLARMSVDFTQTTLNSDDRINVLDLGCKASATNLRATIAQGSSVATLDTLVHNIAVGDMIMLEPSEGRGEIGVGDAWPANRYANSTIIQALPNPGADGYCVGDLSTTKTWRWNDSGSNWTLSDETVYAGNWYNAAIIPKPLVAYVTDVDGAEITLDEVAVKDATDVRVFIDAFGESGWQAQGENPTKLRKLFKDPTNYERLGGSVDIGLIDFSAVWPTTTSVHFPAGYWASMYGPLFLWHHSGVTFTGASEEDTWLYAPNWCPDAGITFLACTNVGRSDMSARGAFRLTSYSWSKIFLDKDEASNPQNTEVPAYVGLPGSAWVAASSTDVTDARLAAEDTWAHFWYGNNNESCHATNLTLRQTEASRRYLAWHCVITNSEDCSIHVRSWISSHRIDGFEQFNSNGCSIVVDYTLNAVGAFNASRNCSLVITDGLLEDGKIDGTHAQDDSSTSFVDVVDHFATGTADNNTVRVNIKIEETVHDVNGVYAATGAVGNRLFDSRIEVARADHYCFYGDESGVGEPEFEIDGCEFVTGVVRTVEGSVENSSGPSLLYKPDVVRVNNDFDAEASI